MERIKFSLHGREMVRRVIFLFWQSEKIGFIVEMWSCIVCPLACQDGMSDMELCMWGWLSGD